MRRKPYITSTYFNCSSLHNGGKIGQNDGFKVNSSVIEVENQKYLFSIDCIDKHLVSETFR
jgi:hypothetical protein